jgi:hypothetical protein
VVAVPLHSLRPTSSPASYLCSCVADPSQAATPESQSLRCHQTSVTVVLQLRLHTPLAVTDPFFSVLGSQPSVCLLKHSRKHMNTLGSHQQLTFPGPGPVGFLPRAASPTREVGEVAGRRPGTQLTEQRAGSPAYRPPLPNPATTAP